MIEFKFSVNMDGYGSSFIHTIRHSSQYDARKIVESIYKGAYSITLIA